MEYTRTITSNNSSQLKMSNPFKAFFKWSEEQQFSRLLFLVAMLLIQTCIIVPFGLLAMTVNEGGSLQIGILVISSFLVITSNLAALPTKYTIPIFCIVNILLISQMIYNSLSFLV